MVFFDSNVIIDALSDRDGATNAERSLLLSATAGLLTGIIAAKQVTDIYYSLRRYVQDEDRRRGFIDILMHRFRIEFTDRSYLVEALRLGTEDYEDAVLAASAKGAGADFIVTNNSKDFRFCGIETKSPAEALEALGL